MMAKEKFEELKKIISEQKSVFSELDTFSNVLKNSEDDEKRIINSQLENLKKFLKELSDKSVKILEEMNFPKDLSIKKKSLKNKTPKKYGILIRDEIEKNRALAVIELERETVKRLKKKREVIKEVKLKKPSKYVATANKFFLKHATELAKKDLFNSTQRNLIKANLQFILPSYISTMLFTTVLSVFFSFLVILFFLFFNIGIDLPIITLAKENFAGRLLKVFWVIFVIPIATFLIMYIYPSLEKKSIEHKINQELPFATIHMASISSAMMEPTNIFSILISTKEYPYLEREFTKIMNEVNIYGYNLVSALRNMAFNNPSRKLSDILNGIATTITSGGDLSAFFEKRSQSLLFEYQLEKEEQIKSSETFMDIYISVVIAAPMIFMLLLIMMKISGLGIDLSTSMISLLMVLGVTGINILFLTFLHLKQP